MDDFGLQWGSHLSGAEIPQVEGSTNWIPDGSAPCLEQGSPVQRKDSAVWEHGTRKNSEVLKMWFFLSLRFRGCMPRFEMMSLLAGVWKADERSKLLMTRGSEESSFWCR